MMSLRLTVDLNPNDFLIQRTTYLSNYSPQQYSESTAMADHNKPCTLCHTPRPVLVRCQIDETGTWNFLCPGACWRSVSGGEEDARGLEKDFPHYRYGGMWKNKHADGPVSAKKPKKVKEKQKERRVKREEAAAAAAKASEHSDKDGEDSDDTVEDDVKS